MARALCAGRPLGVYQNCDWQLRLALWYWKMKRRRAEGEGQEAEKEDEFKETVDDVMGIGEKSGMEDDVQDNG